MPPPLLIELDAIDLDSVCLTQDQIYAYLPHRHEFMLLQGVCHLDQPGGVAVGYCDLREGDWWFRGHVPGRPLLPGVLMLEMAAQMAALLAKLGGEPEGFVAFGGVDGCKFREALRPGSRLYLICVVREIRPRRICADVQGVTDGRLIFEARITGLVMR
ncbi:MAG: 3-hydroxyacyl-ACP dehydratase FabZ family protein [Phycisphaerae bacterium]